MGISFPCDYFSMVRSTAQENVLNKELIKAYKVEPIRVNVNYSDDSVVWNGHQHTKLSRLDTFIKQSFNIDQFTLQYIYNQGEPSKITSNQDLYDALHSCRTNGNTIDIYVI
eukprot:282227_1